MTKTNEKANEEIKKGSTVAITSLYGTVSGIGVVEATRTTKYSNTVYIKHVERLDGAAQHCDGIGKNHSFPMIRCFVLSEKKIELFKANREKYALNAAKSSTVARGKAELRTAIDTLSEAEGLHNNITGLYTTEQTLEVIINKLTTKNSGLAKTNQYKS